LRKHGKNVLTFETAVMLSCVNRKPFH